MTEVAHMRQELVGDGVIISFPSSRFSLRQTSLRPFYSGKWAAIPLMWATPDGGPPSNSRRPRSAA